MSFRRLYKKVSSKLAIISKFPKIIIEHRVITSAVFAAVSATLYSFNIVVGVKNTLSQVITFASIMAAIVGAVISIIVSVKDGALYKKLKDKFSESIHELHKVLKESVAFCVVVVLYSLFILSVDFGIGINPFKIFIALIGFYMFGMMICLCVSVNSISIELLEYSDK